MTVDPVFVFLSVGFIAFLWISSSVQKFSSLSHHRLTVKGYGLLPERLVPAFSILQPVLELAVGLLILLPSLRVVSAVGSVALLAVYSTAIGINLLRGRRDIDCGCTGPAMRQELTEGLIVRNLVLMALSGVAMLPLLPRALGWIDFATLTLGMVGMILIHMAGNLILAQAPVSRLIRVH